MIRQIQSDEDAYVTMQGGGGRHKDKKSKVEMRQVASAKRDEQMSTKELENDKVPAIQECDKEASYPTDGGR